MGLKALLMTMMVAAVVAPALCIDYLVGDDSGWKLDYNYTEWADGKDFRVGDTIQFLSKPGDHSVVKVNGADFSNCINSNDTEIAHTSGNIKFTLLTPGRKWYICDIGDHCSKGMKLVITVGAEGPAPAPVPGVSAAVDLSPFKSYVWMLALIAAYKMIMA